MADDKIRNISGSVEDQLTELRSQIASLKSSLSQRSSEFADEAADVAEDAKGRVRNVISTVKAQGHNVVEAARENPGTATTILSSTGILAFGLGFLVGMYCQTQPTTRSRWS